MLAHAFQQRGGNGFGIGLGVLPPGQGNRPQPTACLRPHTAGGWIESGMCAADDAVAIKRLNCRKIDCRRRQNTRTRSRTLYVGDREPLLLRQRMRRIKPISPAPDAEPIFTRSIAASGDTVRESERNGSCGAPRRFAIQCRARQF